MTTFAAPASREHLRRKAFSLIEILVVIAIIGILTGLLFPVLAQAKRSAKGQLCADNLAGIGRADQLYLVDNDEVYPAGMDPFILPYCSRWNDGEHNCTDPSDIRDLLKPYVKSDQIYACPFDAGFDVLDIMAEYSDQRPTSFSATGSSYWYNEDLYLSSKSSTSIPSPSLAAIAHDRSGSWHGPGTRVQHWTIDRTVEQFRGFRYTTVFADNHVRVLSPRELNIARGAVFCDGCWWLDARRLP